MRILVVPLWSLRFSGGGEMGASEARLEDMVVNERMRKGERLFGIKGNGNMHLKTWMVGVIGSGSCCLDDAEPTCQGSIPLVRHEVGAGLALARG